MFTVILECVPGPELASKVQKEVVRLGLNHTYTVTLQTEDEELAKASSLEEVADIIGQRAEARGLTPKILEKLLLE